MDFLLIYRDKTLYESLLTMVKGSASWEPANQMELTEAVGGHFFSSARRPEHVPEEMERIYSLARREGSRGNFVFLSGEPPPGPKHARHGFGILWAENFAGVLKLRRRLKVLGAKESETRPSLGEWKRSGVSAQAPDSFWELPSPQMQGIYRRLRRVADFLDVPVLICGDTGSGKQHLARYLHQSSRRAGGPWVEVNCAALPENLFESELFGHESGAFTGALGLKKGLLESASGGTLFLDEIGELSLNSQAKLLKVLDQGSVRRLGGMKEQTLDVRIVSATNRRLEQAVSRGQFRGDLYYRLAGYMLEVPSLSRRPPDIAFLARRFFEQACGVSGKPLPSLPKARVDAFCACPWPGGIRELKSAVRRWVLELDEPEEQAVEGDAQSRDAAGPPLEGAHQSEQPLRAADSERLNLERVLRSCQGNRTRAAKLLGLSRQTVISKIREYGLV